MRSNYLLWALLTCSVITLGLPSCSEKNTGDKAKIAIRMTDDPADYDAVNIEIQDLQVNVTGDDDQGWESLPGIQRGIYNLLELVNGEEVMLLEGDLLPGHLHQIRLILGPNNSITVDGKEIPLQTPSAQQSGLKLNVQQELRAGVLYSMLLDFDAGKSIVKTGNGKYILKPVIRLILSTLGGNINGYVKPPVRTAVYALKGNDTVATTFTAPDGGYLLKGLPEGAYDLHYWPIDSTYDHAFKSLVPVSIGNVTQVDTVYLDQ